jgi:hypothetical protein
MNEVSFDSVPSIMARIKVSVGTVRFCSPGPERSTHRSTPVPIVALPGTHRSVLPRSNAAPGANSACGSLPGFSLNEFRSHPYAIR